MLGWDGVIQPQEHPRLLDETRTATALAGINKNLRLACMHLWSVGLYVQHIAIE
jgi:hypothetical protein